MEKRPASSALDQFLSETAPTTKTLEQAVADAMRAAATVAATAKPLAWLIGGTR